MDEWMDGWMIDCIGEWTCGCMIGMDGCNGCMVGWLDVCVCSLLVVDLLSLWRGLISRKLFYLAGGPWRGLNSRKPSLSVDLCCFAVLFCCWMNGWMDGLVDGWFGWMDGFDGWMDGWMCGRVD